MPGAAGSHVQSEPHKWAQAVRVAVRPDPETTRCRGRLASPDLTPCTRAQWGQPSGTAIRHEWTLLFPSSLLTHSEPSLVLMHLAEVRQSRSLGVANGHRSQAP